MDTKTENIFYAFNGKLVGNKNLKKYVCEAVAKLPDEIIDFVTKNCWFVSSFDDAYGFTFTGNDIKDQHLIFLSEELFLEDDRQIYFTIAHEIGHVIYKHKNSVLDKQSKAEIKIQEKEADSFANKYIE